MLSAPLSTCNIEGDQGDLGARRKELLQEGDPVNFQVSQTENFALNVKSNKQKLRSHVEAVKGQFGFLSYEQDEGKKLFFHMSEVEGGDISVGCTSLTRASCRG